MNNKVFFDSNVYIAGFASETGASRAIIKLAGKRHFDLLICRLVVEESIRNFKKKLPRSLDDFILALNELKPSFVEQPIKLNRKLLKLFPKSTDQIIFETAQKAKIRYFISLNRKHFHAPKVKSLAKFEILTPAEFLKQIQP